ncbi:hypothetical protein G6L33_11150 [Agrobacterium rhizogenes]|nr:hypothetical protein [Rhizobium rhizogenes]NTH64408.1 hypothetical protein [Rhizobium rhizogenes]NTJ32088.1 hypothetical protein [Rhizobium rhizogenes]
MNWQVKYALDLFQKRYADMTAESLSGDVIKLTVQSQPDVIAAVSGAKEIDAKTAEHYVKETPYIDFLCGYRKECVWHGTAIKYLEDREIGWGSPGTLGSAAQKGEAKEASHKDFAFAYRLLKQTASIVKGIEREYDRLYDVTVKSGRTLRVGLIQEYEPTADAVRSFWEKFDAVDVFWNINPNGNPTKDAIQAAKELGCQVLKWDDLREYLAKA